MTYSTYASQQLPEEKVFKDPIHRYIHVKNQIIWDLIKTKEFQRLRRIKQLGTLYLSFHTAEHSRFGHSLGVYEIVRRLIDESFSGREAWDDKDAPLALCAALLHDLGHGPFSHSFEKIFNTDHEAFTQAIITGPTEVNEVLSRVSPTFPQEVADVINKTHDNKLVISMISSQIDADRMDYLQRDAYFTGVSYGQFDMERILRLMRPSKDEVLIKESGMHAVENFIMSRYQMYWQIYFHPVSRGGEVLLNNCLKRAKQLYNEGYQFKMYPTDFIPFFEETVTIVQYVDLDEVVVQYYLKAWVNEDDAILSDLARRFINRDLFKYMPFDGSIITITELTDLFVQAGIDPNYYFVSESFTDLPYDYDRPGSNRQPIHLLRRNGTIREISNESLVISSITGINREDYKLYYPKELISDVTDDNVRNAIISILNELN
ncbi:MAG TPA: HD domain-containing protein [Staphylococcus kloosii]|uniref:HD domain-containing protein n=1 Tax=Staphylococcus kloosii TaxID=29384 RepID=A0A921H3D8_9STAP|nr:HD domain-containing protein [Staphylococcus kloosii]HJF68950.1 HD domain-containing protein [Staphylococcus kloosii]